MIIEPALTATAHRGVWHRQMTGMARVQDCECNTVVARVVQCRARDACAVITLSLHGIRRDKFVRAC
jgi:hypothetical protein